MNCRPGDLAIIVHAGNPECAENIGAIVCVVELFDDRTWIVESRGRLLAGFTTDGFTRSAWIAAYDTSLRPIRPESESTTHDEPIAEAA